MRGLMALLFSLIPLVLAGTASPDIILTVVDGSELDDLHPRPEKPVSIGDRVPLSTCGAQLMVGIRTSTSAPDWPDSRIRLAKRRLANRKCEVEVLTIEQRPSRRHESSARSGSSHDPNAGADHWPIAASRADPRHVPCGTQLIDIRQGPQGGNSFSVNGQEPSDVCATVDDELNGPLSVSLLNADAPSSLGVDRTQTPEPSP